MTAAEHIERSCVHSITILPLEPPVLLHVSIDYADDVAKITEVCLARINPFQIRREIC